MIENIAQLTRFIDNPLGTPAKLMYWRMHGTSARDSFPLHFFATHPADVYNQLKFEKAYPNELFVNFNERVMNQITLEKHELHDVLRALETLLNQFCVLPNFSITSSIGCANNSVSELIAHKKQELGHPNKQLFELSAAELKTIDTAIKEVNAACSISCSNHAGNDSSV